MLNLITDLVVAEASNVANFARLTNIMDGVDGSSVLGYTIEEESIEIEDKQKHDIAFNHSLDIRVIDRNADTATLKDFVDNQKDVLISALTPSGFMLWHKPVKLVINRQFDNIVALAVKASIKTPVNYHGTAPNVNKGVYGGSNALALFDVIDGADTRINGFTGDISNSTLTINTSGGVTFQSIENTGGQDHVAFTDLFLPFPGKTVTFAIDAETSGVVGQMRLTARNAPNDADVGTPANADITAVPSTDSVSYTLPAGTFFVRASVAPGVNTTDVVAFSKPRLRIDGSTQWTP